MAQLSKADKDHDVWGLTDEQLAYHVAEEAGCGAPALWWLKDLVNELWKRDTANKLDFDEYEKGFDRWLNEFFISKERELPAYISNAKIAELELSTIDLPIGMTEEQKRIISWIADRNRLRIAKLKVEK